MIEERVGDVGSFWSLHIEAQKRRKSKSFPIEPNRFERITLHHIVIGAEPWCDKWSQYIGRILLGTKEE